MKKACISLLFLSLSLLSYAQFPGQSGGKGQKMPSIGHLFGKIIDSKTNEPVEFASVALYIFGKDSVIAGQLTKSNGEFSLDNLPIGGFKLKISFIGYKSIEQKVFINFQKYEQDLGDIKIEPDASLLEEAVINAEKSTMVMNIDKKEYNVDKDISTRGGTALDVMKNVPGVNVDVDGNTTLRNSTPQIYVNGRPTSLTLQQIPADQIEKIEVITNPSVKFEAAASGGILNIVLKKNTKPGYNGVIMAGAGTTDRYNGMANLNIKENPWALSLMYNYNTGTNITKGYTRRTNLYNNSTIGYFNQDNNNRGSQGMQMGRIGIDYALNNRNALSLSGVGVFGFHKNSDHQDFEVKDNSNVLITDGERVNDSKAVFSNYTGQLTYTKTFIKPGKSFIIDANYNKTISNNSYIFSTFNYLGGSILPENPEMQKNTGSTDADMLNIQADYVNPLTDTSKLEWGFRSNIKKSNSKNNTYNYSYSSSNYEFDSILSNNYFIDDIVNAAYINYVNRFRKVNVQMGLRFEQSYYSGTIAGKNESFFYNYPSKADNIYKSLFPGIYFSRKFSGNNEFQLNFSRKIERPNFFQLMPFIMFADKQNYRIGNPTLTPEFRNIAEFNYNKIFKKGGNFLSSVYFRYIETPISNLAYPSEVDSSVLVNTFVNGESSFNYGWDNSFKMTFWKNLDLLLNFNTFYVVLNSGDKFNNITTQGFQYNAKTTISYRFPKDFTLQVNGNYESPKLIIQGYTVPQYFMDISLNKSINRVWIINAIVSDVFNTKRMGSHYDTDFYIQDLSRRREARYFKIALTHMFGKMDASIFKKAKSMRRGEGQSGQDGLDF